MSKAVKIIQLEASLWVYLPINLCLGSKHTIRSLLKLTVNLILYFCFYFHIKYMYLWKVVLLSTQLNYLLK